MGYQLIARALSVTLFALGLWCLAQAGIFSTSHVVTSGTVVQNIWSTTASPTNDGTGGANITWVSKWIGGTSPPPGSNAHVVFTLKAAQAFLLSGMYFGGSQTVASQCSGTLRVWNFASAPITILTQTTIGTGGFTTGLISIPSWPGTPFAISMDSASGQNKPNFTNPTSSNTNPVGTTSDFITYNLNKGSSPGEAATQCKSASYTTTAAQIRAVIGMTSYP